MNALPSLPLGEDSSGEKTQHWNRPSMSEECFPQRRLHRRRRKNLEHIDATTTQVFKHLTEKLIRLILYDTPRHESLQRRVYGGFQQVP
ncbi:MAG: hypothetical protein QXG52_09240 [Candidatus Caldarchaeum sp.]